MASLEDLCPEILEKIVLKFELVEDVISLGSCCTYLARIVGREMIWRVLLAKTDLVDEWGVMALRVKKITTFLSCLGDCEAIFSLLHQIIYERCRTSAHYTSQWSHDSITVSFPTCPQLDSVFGLGLQLLALSAREGARHSSHQIKLYRISSSLLFALATLEKKQMMKVEMFSVTCTSEEDGSALVSLLESSAAWKVEVVLLEREVGMQTWERLSAEAARGRLSFVMAGMDVVMRGRLRIVTTQRKVVARGRREDVLAVWENTVEAWVVDNESIFKNCGIEQGSKKIKEMILSLHNI